MMPGKPVAARGKRFSPAELEAARRVRLADVIADDLVVLFCGANPGLSSAAARAPFATPSDRWWPALYESGFTPRRLAPQEAHELLALGLGLTSLVRRPTVGVAELARAEFVEGGRLLRRRVVARRPRWLAVLGVTAYRAAFGRPDAAVGLQEDTIGSTRLWILPNPSGLNAHYPPRALATEFARLRVAAGLPDRSRRQEDATLCRLLFGLSIRSGKRPRQPEPWHHARVEAGDRGDVVVGDRDDMQSVGPVDTCVGIGHIHTQRRLAVGAGRHHPVGPAGPEGDGCEEPAGQVDAPVLQHRGRHGDSDVLGEQPYQGLEVGSFEGVGQLSYEVALGRGVRLARGPAAA